MSPPEREPLQPAAVVLAAGTSSRFGRSKQLASWRGESLVRRATRLVCDLGAEPVVVVLGAGSDTVRQELQGLPCTTANNPDFESGQASSVRVGLAAVRRSHPEAAGCLFLPIDQPRLSLTILRRLVDRWRQLPDRVVQPRVAGRPSSPTLFPRRLFDRLSKIDGDRGGTQLLRSSGSDPERPVHVDFEGDEARRLVDYDEAHDFETAEREESLKERLDSGH